MKLRYKGLVVHLQYNSVRNRHVLQVKHTFGGLVLKPPQPPHPHNPHTPTTLDDHGGCGVVGV